jgi:hypothetical protein
MAMLLPSVELLTVGGNVGNIRKMAIMIFHQHGQLHIRVTI